MLANDKEKAVIEELDKDGAESKDIAGTLGKLSQASKAEDKRAALIEADLTDEQKQCVYEELIIKSKSKMMQTCLNDGMSINEFLQYANKFDGSDSFAERYNTLKSKGVKGTDAVNIVTGIAALKPMPGKSDVNFVQKLQVISSSSLNDAGKLSAVNAELDDTTVTKMNIASKNGINVDTYTQFQETLPRFDADGNGSYKQAEVETALDNMNLTNTERAVLWQLHTGGKHNPFDSAVGANIRAEAASNKEAAKAATNTTAGGFAIGGGINITEGENTGNASEHLKDSTPHFIIGGGLGE